MPGSALHLFAPLACFARALCCDRARFLSFHRALVRRKYRELFSSKTHGKPGPKGPSPGAIPAIVEMKRRNPGFGYQRIADQISLAFGIAVNKDVARRVITNHYRPGLGSGGSSKLTFLGHSKDSLWSINLFRCESLILQTHRVMVVMDQCTRQIIGFAVFGGIPDGPAVCQMFGRTVGRSAPPTGLSSDNDPQFEFHRWKANPRSCRDQDSSLCAALTSVHRAAHWKNPARVSHSGAPGICRESCSRFSDITIGHVYTSPAAAEHPTRQRPTRHGTPQGWTITNGTHTVVACFNYQ